LITGFLIRLLARIINDGEDNNRQNQQIKHYCQSLDYGIFSYKNSHDTRHPYPESSNYQKTQAVK